MNEDILRWLCCALLKQNDGKSVAVSLRGDDMDIGFDVTFKSDEDGDGMTVGVTRDDEIEESSMQVKLEY